jgi:hypothetical protein
MLQRFVVDLNAPKCAAGKYVCLFSLLGIGGAVIEGHMGSSKGSLWLFFYFH